MKLTQRLTVIILVNILALLCFINIAYASILLDHTFVHSVDSAFVNGMDDVNKFLLLMGWWIYWMKKMNEARLLAKKKTYIKQFVMDNIFEVPTSAITFISIIFIAPEIPSTLMDFHGRLTVFMLGMGGSSAINGLITMARPATKE